MGKLTDSLKETSKQLDRVKDGVRQMQALGEGIAENAEAVAEAGLRTGYAYAQVEAARAEVERAEAGLSEVALEPWTLETLKAEFGSAARAYAHLKTEFGVTLRSRSWANILATFNGEKSALPSQQPASARLSLSTSSKSDHSLEKRVVELERLTLQQADRIAVLEAKLESLLNRFAVGD